MSENQGWLNRLPTVEEVEAHAKVHPCHAIASRTYGEWRCVIDGDARLVRLCKDGNSVCDWRLGILVPNESYLGARWLPLTAEGLPVGWVDPESAQHDREQAYHAGQASAAYADQEIGRLRGQIAELRANLETSEAHVESLNAELADAVSGERAADQEVERLRKRCEAHEKRIDELRNVMRSARILINFKDGDSMSHVKHGIGCARDLLNEGHADDYVHAPDPDEYGNHLVKQIRGLHEAMADSSDILAEIDGGPVGVRDRLKVAMRLLERRAVIPFRVPVRDRVEIVVAQRNAAEAQVEQLKRDIEAIRHDAKVSMVDQIRTRATALEVNGQRHAAVKLRHAADLIADVNHGHTAEAWRLIKQGAEARGQMAKLAEEKRTLELKLSKQSVEHGEIREFLRARPNENTIDAARRIFSFSPDAVCQIEQSRERMNLSPGTTLLSEIDALVSILRPIGRQRLSWAARHHVSIAENILPCLGLEAGSDPCVTINATMSLLGAKQGESLYTAAGRFATQMREERRELLCKLEVARDDSELRQALGAMLGESTAQAAGRMRAQLDAARKALQ